MSTRPILIVDDDEDIRSVLTELFDEAGYVSATATNGLEAIAYIESHPPPAVVLLDIMMPKMSGWEFLRVREGRHDIAAVPVVVMSANLELIRKSEVKGIERLAKPFDTNQLLRLMAKWVGAQA